MKSEGQMFNTGKRIRKKKQRPPDEVSDWDSCEEDTDSKRSPIKKSLLYDVQKIEMDSSSELSEDSASDEQWPILLKQSRQQRRETPENGVEGKSDAEKKQFTCEFCSYKNWRQHCVTTHMNRNHKSMLACNVCSYKAKNVKLLKSHTSVHADSTALEQEDTKKQASQPVKKDNEVAAKKDNDVEDGKQEPCGTLGRQNPDDREKDKENEEGKGNTNPTPPTPANEEDKEEEEERTNSSKKQKKKGPTLFKCEHCSYTSHQKCHVGRHTRERHLYEKRRGGRGPITCNECNYRTTRVQSMARHNLTHAGAKPYRCEICNYKTSQKNNLERHHRTHTGESPFACEICEYRSKQSNDLAKHMRSHTGEKPYACDLCDYRSSQHSSLSAHLKKAHCGKGKFKTMLYSCDLCPFTSKTAKPLRSHMKTSHCIDLLTPNRQGRAENPTQSPDTGKFSLQDLGNVEIKIEMEDMATEMVFIKQEECEEEEVKFEDESENDEIEGYKLLEL